MKLGIVGLPNVGKSTLFNAITSTKNAEAANYPFCTIEPNSGIVAVPDKRLDKLAEIWQTNKKTPAIVEFVDIAGLVKGASQGAGLGNKFLGHIRECDAIVHVVRCFDDDNIIHVVEDATKPVAVDPDGDIECIDTELILSDLEMVQNRIARITRAAKSGNKAAAAELEWLKALEAHLGEGKSARTFPMEEGDDSHAAAWRELGLLSAKPIIYACNMDDDGVAAPENNPYYQIVRARAETEGAQVLPICAKTEEELAELDKQGKIAWEKYQHPEPEPGVWIVYIPTATIDIAEYDANGSWYVYAKAENLKGTTYVSTPKLIADVEKPKAINLSTDKELETDGEYWGDLRFRVEDALPVKVWHERYPGGNIELMTPDEDGCYTIPADYDVSLHHDICIEDACGNKTYYNDIDILWNYLEVVREKDYWDVQPAQPIRISREQDLQEELSKVNIGIFCI